MVDLRRNFRNFVLTCMYKSMINKSHGAQHQAVQQSSPAKETSTTTDAQYATNTTAYHADASTIAANHAQNTESTAAMVKMIKNLNNLSEVPNLNNALNVNFGLKE